MQQEPPVSGGSYCHIVKPINNPQLLQNLRQTIQPFLRRDPKKIFSAPILSRRLTFFISSLFPILLLLHKTVGNL